MEFLNLFNKKYIYLLVFLFSLGFSQDPPELFEFNQSTLQAFYLFEGAFDINGNPLEPDDWVGAFKGDVCVGARNWDTSVCGGGLCDVPVMGNDGGDYSTGYMITGDIPTFKVYDASEDTYYDAQISIDYSNCSNTVNCSWSNFDFNILNEIHAVILEDSIPELFDFNISTLQAFYYFYDAFNINGENLDANDWVAAFNGDVCVGARRWDNSVCGGGVCDVPVMGEDGSSYSEGYMQNGNFPSFKIYDSSEDIYYDAIVSENHPWENFGFNMIDYIQAVEYVELSIPLHYENNLISFYTLPDNTEISNVISDIENNLVGIISESFSAQNNNGAWEGSLTEFDTYKGYWLRMSSESDILTVTGPPPNPNKIYELHTGLNLVSFPTNGSISISDGIDDSIEEQIPFVIGESRAAAQLDGQWVGSLMNFEGGKGYWINSNIDLDFQYNLENLSLSRKNNTSILIDEFSFIQSSAQSFYFINLNNLSSNMDVRKGDWIIAYNNNVVVGARQWNGGIVDVPVMGADGHYSTASYCNENDIPTFKIYSVDSDQLFEISSNDINRFVPNSVTYIKQVYKASKDNLTPEKFSIISAYPNPFNPISTISFSVPIDSYISIIIYDIKGNVIEILTDKYYNAGYHDISWKANSETSGIYFVKITSGDFQDTKKIMLIK